MADNVDPTRKPKAWGVLAQLVVLSAILAAGLAIVLTSQLLPSRYQFREGDVVTFNIKSPSKVSYISQIETKAARDREAAKVPEVVEYDVGVASLQARRAEEVLRQITDLRREASPLEQKLRALPELTGINLSSGAAREALTMDESSWLATSLETRRVLNQAMSERFSQEQMRDVVKRVPYLVDQQFPPERRAVVAELVAPLLRPNLIPNPEKTAEEREAARAAVQPIWINVEKGEIILRDGDVVKPLDIEKLQKVGLSNPTVNWGDVLANGLLAALLVLVLACYLYVLQPATWSNPRRLALVYGVIFVGVVAAKIIVPGRDLWAYVFPVAAVPMLLATLLDAHVGLVAIALLAPLIGLVAGGSLEITTASLVAGIVGLLGVWRMERQARAFIAGAGVAGATFLVVASFKLGAQDIELGQLLMIGFLCLVNGALSAVMTLGTSSMLGHIFGVTTSAGLLELAHPSHPLFRRLLTHAPGTYHHSVVVANLAERAAQQVGADSLLVRVGAYYHDIGKVMRPYCFVENQVDGQNIHDKLSPQMSAKLVAAHVKDGLQMAKQHGLPSKVRDIIEQHHGTKLTKYFYHQACKDGCDGQVAQEDFRYAGPRPQSKEAAIIMLADTVEAAVRAADDRSSENISRLVGRLVNETLIEGQLNECDLSVRDLQTIKEAFTSVLQGIFHPRVRYPEPSDGLLAEETGAPLDAVRAGKVGVEPPAVEPLAELSEDGETDRPADQQ